jgi:hypothetical protein
VTISPYSVREGYLLTHVLGKESPCVQG